LVQVKITFNMLRAKDLLRSGTKLSFYTYSMNP
jgi:hypothetical protein